MPGAVPGLPGGPKPISCASIGRFTPFMACAAACAVLTLGRPPIIMAVENLWDFMISVAFLSGPDTLLLIAVLLLLFPAFFVKRFLGGPLYNLGHMVGRLTRPTPRTRQQAKGTISGDDEDLEPSAAFLEAKYRKVLGLTGRITPEDVKRRWRDLSRQYHPDYVQHLGPKLRTMAEQEMKTINEAYQYLCRKYGL